MSIVLNASACARAFLSAAAALDANKDWINELNVFPVPDGDTGTNMTLTIMSAANEVQKAPEGNMAALCKAISSGSLRGARGNSGVILSQLLRGLTHECQDAEQLDPVLLATAFTKAVDTAYKAVMKPKEGTILTVARAMSDKAMELVPDVKDPIEFLQKVVDAGNEALANTPNQLPVLKQAGVVDSGGQGLMVLMQAGLDSFRGNTLEFKGMTSVEIAKGVSPQLREPLETEEIRFGYCTEFIILSGISEQEEKEFKAFLESIGDSIVCVADSDLVKVHVHTNDPGKAISKALTYGELSRLKIDNMREEHHERFREQQEPPKAPSREHKKSGVISVCAGDGLQEIFLGLGVDVMIQGGQTMNPSTEDVLQALDECNADTVYVLPNNSNIILTATQAASLAENCNVVVIPTKTVQQGIAAMISFMPDDTPEKNQESMAAAIAAVKSVEVTYAIRDTSIDGIEIREGHTMALGDQGLLSSQESTQIAVLDALGQLIGEDTELVTFYYGAEVREEEAEELVAAAQTCFPLVEFELVSGGQPVYYYLISIE